jgi:hypothetical protein
MSDIFSGLGGTLDAGELVTVEHSAGRSLSHALYVRWSAGG